MTDISSSAVIGLDFGTTNTVAAIATRDGEAALLPLRAPEGVDPVFRSALCFWEEAHGIASAAGPAAIEEYLAFPQGCRFIQSFKTVAASPSFNHATIFGRRWSFEELGHVFLRHLRDAAGAAFAGAPDRLIVGRPVEYAGHRPDAALARSRYDAMFAGAGRAIHYVYEPLAAAFSYATRLDAPATVLVADFGGGTSDFSVVRIAAPGSARRCTPIGHAGVGIAGDRFDRRIVDHLLLPLLGLGGTYRSFDKVLDIPRGYFGDVADWSRLALMNNPKTLAELDRLRRSASEPEAIGRMIAIVEEEQGYALYDAVGRLKRQLSVEEHGTFRFAGGGVDISADVDRATFERWIAPDLARIEAAVDRALASATVSPAGIDRVFLTGGTSLTPCIRRMFVDRFGEDRLAAGEELTSIAHGLALIGQESDLTPWEAQ